jgi:hypothetical protein
VHVRGPDGVTVLRNMAFFSCTDSSLLCARNLRSRLCLCLLMQSQQYATLLKELRSLPNPCDKAPPRNPPRNITAAVLEGAVLRRGKCGNCTD